MPGKVKQKNLIIRYKSQQAIIIHIENVVIEIIWKIEFYIIFNLMSIHIGIRLCPAFGQGIFY